MAIYDVSVKMRDAYQRVSTRRYQIDVADHATAVGEAATMVGHLAAISEAEVLEYRVGLNTVYSDSPDAGANIDAGITLSVELDSGKKAVLKVPAPIPGILNADGTVDVTATAVTNLLSNWLTGHFLLSDGETVAALLSGKLDK